MSNEGFIEQDRALESMRESDFDCYSAYGEIIDNSIEAEANEIYIDFEEKMVGRKKKIDKIVFADNGHGMKEDVLHKCLKLGHSSRYNERNGIGRFGVGMTLGGIHECRRIEVYSKVKGGDWLYTYLDLDEIKNNTLKFIPAPKSQKPNTRLLEKIQDAGTIVVWTKYDRQNFSYEKIISETKIWIGRTFRKFIQGVSKNKKLIKIYVNSEIVKAIDPLFNNKTNTGFEGEAQSELFAPIILEWDIPEDAKSSKQKSTIKISTSLLPSEYRRERGLGGDTYAKERNFDKNEGISIVRNDREVFFGDIPYSTKLKSTEIDRFIGIEISFEAELDSEFSVKNIKRGAVPKNELKEKLEELIYPTIKTCRSKIQDKWNEEKREIEDSLAKENNNIGVSSSHGPTNAILKTAKDTLLKGNKNDKPENDVRIVKKLHSEIDIEKDKAKVKLIIEGLKDNGITIEEKEFIGDSFIDIEHGGGIKTILYNTNSVFYKAYNEILNELKEKNESLANDYKILIDLIFVSYMLAESNINPKEKTTGEDFANEIKSYWSIQMNKILNQWKKK